jgi:hypothetical protein
MLSPLRVTRLSCLSLSPTRNFSSISNQVRRKKKPTRVTSKETSVIVPSPAATLQHDADVSAVEYDLATSLNRYFSLPPLPPVEKWLSHFSYSTVILRDRISLRTPATAISVAQSFINSKKTFTGKPKVIVEAFPGVRCLKAVMKLFLIPCLGPGALSRAFLTLPPSQLRRLIILEDHEPYLEYLRVRLCFLLCLYIVKFLFVSPSLEQTLAYELCPGRVSVGKHILIY